VCQYFNWTRENEDSDEFETLGTITNSSLKKRKANSNKAQNKRLKCQSVFTPSSLQINKHTVSYTATGVFSTTVLTSTFVPDQSIHELNEQATKSVSVSFKRTICTIDERTLFLSAGDQGKTKDVYGVSNFCIAKDQY
jgi:hypothetical protein